MFSDGFMGYRKGALGTNGLNNLKLTILRFFITSWRSRSTSEMECFTKIANGSKSLTIFTK